MRASVAFRDRIHAGRLLAGELSFLKDQHPILFGLVRGGVMVAKGVSESLDAPLYPMLARKIGAPGQPELGIGAVSPGVTFLQEDLIRRLRLSDGDVERATQLAQSELVNIKRSFPDPYPDLSERTVILVDDGLATGATAIAAARSLRRLNPRRLVLAVPVASDAAAEAVAVEVDEVVCMMVRSDLVSVGSWYEDFSQTTEADVLEALREHGPPRN